MSMPANNIFTPRMGAGTYLLLMSASVTVWSLVTVVLCRAIAWSSRAELIMLNILVSGTGSMLGAIFYAASIRRLKDLNFPAWSVKVLSFPLIGVIALPVLAFLSGARWADDYGNAPKPSGFIKTMVALVLFVIAMGASYSALLTYYSIRHALLAQP
ncbi:MULTISPECIES: DUF805 domain-containing protein [unclassified Variovorax]|uniref:DUF805 domain-containing protein n=1 Tax=unclassified Variovorax TaxID=663243 RepID=UPI003F465E1A